MNRIGNKILFLHSFIIHLFLAPLIFIENKIVPRSQAIGSRIGTIEKITAHKSGIDELHVPFAIFIRTMKCCRDIFGIGNLIVHIKQSFVGLSMRTCMDRLWIAANPLLTI